MTPLNKPSGTSGKAIYAQALYESIRRRRALPAPGLLTSVTTRGTHRTPMFRRPQTSRNSPFSASWLFRYAGLGSLGQAQYETDLPQVEGGISMASTVVERSWVSAGDIETAINSPSSGAANSFRIVQSGLMNPVDSIRIQATCDPLGADGDLRGTVYEGTALDNVTPCLYFRLIEAPFAPEQIPTGGSDESYIDATEGFKPVPIVYQSALSHDGFHVYAFSVDGNAIIIPDERVLAIVEAGNSNHILKPRNGWGGVYLSYGALGSGKIIFSEQTTDNFVFEPFEQIWDTPTGPTNSDRNRFPTTTVMSGSDVYWQPVFDGITDGFEITIDSQPNDGDIIRASYTNRQYLGSAELPTMTWKTVVADSTKEVEIGADLTETRNNFEGFLGTNGGRFIFAPTYRISAGRWLTLHSGLQAIYNRSPYSTAFVRYTPVVKIGSFGTITRVLALGAENTWTPTSSAFNKPTASRGNIDSCYRSDWMAIPLTAAFDATVDLPAFQKPFYIQAFFGKFLDIHPDRTIPEFSIDLAVEDG